VLAQFGDPASIRCGRCTRQSLCCLREENTTGWHGTNALYLYCGSTRLESLPRPSWFAPVPPAAYVGPIRASPLADHRHVELSASVDSVTVMVWLSESHQLCRSVRPSAQDDRKATSCARDRKFAGLSERMHADAARADGHSAASNYEVTTKH
jgi:hypothetical protein